MLRMPVIVTAVLLSTSELLAQGKGIRLWNLTTATISNFQLSPAGKDSWGPNQARTIGTRRSTTTSACVSPVSSPAATTPGSAIATPAMPGARYRDQGRRGILDRRQRLKGLQEVERRYPSRVVPREVGTAEYFSFINIKLLNIFLIPILKTSLILLASCSMRGRFLEAILQRTEQELARPGRPGTVDRLGGQGGAPGGLAAGPLPRHLAPPRASPRVSRGTGKPRTHCAARMRRLVRHSGALAPCERTRNLDVGARRSFTSGFRVRAKSAPRNDEMKWLFEN